MLTSLVILFVVVLFASLAFVSLVYASLDRQRKESMPVEKPINIKVRYKTQSGNWVSK